MDKIKALIQQVTALDKVAMQEMETYLFSLAKPPGSLGKLEQYNIQLAGIYGSCDYQLDKRIILIFCSDNGVVVENVSSAPQSITLMQTLNFTKKLSGVGVLSKVGEADNRIIDIGINAEVNHPQIINAKVRKSTENIAQRDALTRKEVIQAILIGANQAKIVIEEGYQMLGIGEMGIGNTTTSSAVLAKLTGLSVLEVSGKGGGLAKGGYEHKCAIIQKAIDRTQGKMDVIDILGSVGGLDLCGMCGAYLQGAALHKVMVVDGFISAVAALCATRLAPYVKEYLIPSHSSYEVGYQRVMDELQLEPPLNLGMRLGEGSGCPIAFKLLDFAKAILTMAKLKDISEDPYYKGFTELEF